MTGKMTSKDIVSVGIDIGTSTTHMVFSKLTLKEDPLSRTRKFIISKREILYRSPIHFTPLKDFQTIDVKKLELILNNEYRNSGININNVDTGAVIITGETARKENADTVLNLMSENAGKVVAAAAGPNFESVLSCHGAGITDYSLINNKTILHTDIGGGTSNIALAKEGTILTTACINIGGRLITFDSNGIISKIENAANITANNLGISLELGQKFEKNVINKICDKLADCLLEILFSTTPYTQLTQDLLMTNPLFGNSTYLSSLEEISFSGGVAEFIYNISKNDNYQDIGKDLAKSIINKLSSHDIKLHSPNEKIRATVIGAGQYSMEVSGSTTFISPTSQFPLKNLPVISPYIDRSRFSQEHIVDAINDAYNRMDTIEGSFIVALSFKNPVGIVYNKIRDFVQGIERALPQTLEKKLPIILLFDSDIGKSIGNILKRETRIESDIISIDEIEVREGDFLDIGEPIIANQVVPVIVKSLVFI